VPGAAEPSGSSPGARRRRPALSQPAVPAPLQAVDLTSLPSAVDFGRFCATQARGARALQKYAAAYAKLFPTEFYDGGMFSSVVGANVSSAPWLSAEELRLTNLATLCAFAVDRAIDDIAASWEDVQRVLTGCLAVAADTPDAETDDLTRLLATLRNELAAVGAAPQLYGLWRDVLGRTLQAMGRGWAWNQSLASPAATLPTVDEYLASPENLGLSFVYVSLWISTRGWSAVDRIDDLMALCRQAEQVVRLLNDLRSYERDAAKGHLNVLHLGIGPDEALELARTIADRVHRSLRAEAGAADGLNVYLDRLIDFNMGFYTLTDYWGGP
jgi:Terpene synthase family 2, C-terminal metal binding